MNKTNKEILLELLDKIGQRDIVVADFEEAKSNNRRRNIVLIDGEEGYFDIYLTYKRNGTEFGEFICWVESEFLDYHEEDVENELIEIVVNGVEDLYERTDVELDSENCTFISKFTSYTDAE